MCVLYIYTQLFLAEAISQQIQLRTFRRCTCVAYTSKDHGLPHSSRRRYNGPAGKNGLATQPNKKSD